MHKSIRPLNQPWLRLAGKLVRSTVFLFAISLAACEQELLPAPEAALPDTNDLSELNLFNMDLLGKDWRYKGGLPMKRIPDRNT